jgi:hypothetical protein
MFWKNLDIHYRDVDRTVLRLEDSWLDGFSLICGKMNA